ncbi:hypothetical protein AOQ84DRAFT_230731 [Glonium stellatum]|uniref:Uncharacterized protein n=1 Tax=Glonium stellatum TaxID=574774 RepID=A0A8E2F5N0_9PEZI|nr:hypothetical protein AOQ84DRAFT_230731 [Glonium stellatum]
MDGWMDGWMDGLVDGRVAVGRAGVRGSGLEMGGRRIGCWWAGWLGLVVIGMRVSLGRDVDDDDADDAAAAEGWAERCRTSRVGSGLVYLIQEAYLIAVVPTAKERA